MAVVPRLYAIRRPVDSYGEVDPAGALEFDPPKDSDELFEALRLAFPYLKTHKERVREAVIDFHLSERDQLRLSNLDNVLTGATALLPSTVSMGTATPAPISAPMTLTTSHDSGASDMAHSFNSGSLTSASVPSTQTIPTSPLPTPALGEMTSVWSLSHCGQPKIRTRRTMTESEKKEYRRKRIDGACSDCRRRRRKCDHASSDSDDLNKAKKTRKTQIRKSQTATTAGPHMPSLFLEQYSTSTSPSLATTASPAISMEEIYEQPHGSLDWWSQLDADSLAVPDLSMHDIGGYQLIDVLGEEQQWHDPIFEFVDFEGGNGPLFQQGNYGRSTTPLRPQEHARPSSSSSLERLGVSDPCAVDERTIVQRHSPRNASSIMTAARPQLVDCSGTPVPLPPYYARTTQDLVSLSGGTYNCRASKANIPFIRPHEVDSGSIPTVAWTLEMMPTLGSGRSQMWPLMPRSLRLAASREGARSCREHTDTTSRITSTCSTAIARRPAPGPKTTMPTRAASTMDFKRDSHYGSAHGGFSSDLEQSSIPEVQAKTLERIGSDRAGIKMPGSKNAPRHSRVTPLRGSNSTIRQSLSGTTAKNEVLTSLRPERSEPFKVALHGSGCQQPPRCISEPHVRFAPRKDSGLGIDTRRWLVRQGRTSHADLDQPNGQHIATKLRFRGDPYDVASTSASVMPPQAVGSFNSITSCGQLCMPTRSLWSAMLFQSACDDIGTLALYLDALPALFTFLWRVMSMLDSKAIGPSPGPFSPLSHHLMV